MHDLLILDATLVKGTFENLGDHLDAFLDYRFIFFKHAKENAEVAGLIKNYEKLINAVEEREMAYAFTNECGLDEYLDTHRHQDQLFIANTPYQNTIISSAALLKVTIPIFVFQQINQSTGLAQFQNIQPMTTPYLASKKFGTAGLDFTYLPKVNILNQVCYFEWHKERYTFRAKKPALDAEGVEGYTFPCPGYPGFRIKIYKRSISRYEVERIEKLTRISDQFPDAALPLAIVYAENDIPVGIAMRDFEGSELDIYQLHTYQTASKIVISLTRQLLGLSTWGVLHKDLTHNVLCDPQTGESHIIDIDSTQYLDYPAVVSATDTFNCMPQKYFHNRLFYNTIDLSYSMLMIVISAFINPDDLFGNYDENGNVQIREEELQNLKRHAPDIYRLVEKAYIQCIPVSLSEQYAVLTHLETPKTRVYETRHGDGNYGDYPGAPSIEEGPDEFIDLKLESEDPSLSEEEISFLQKWILSLFLKNGRTAIAGETDAERWDRFMREKQWVSPLIYVICSLLAILFILIAIFH